MDQNIYQSVDQLLQTDEMFNAIFPPMIRELAALHWTPLHICRLAVDFLSSGTGEKILDIGSGAGKFCLAGACFAPKHHFYGIEQRGDVMEHGVNVQRKIGIANVSFMPGNFTQLDLRRFDHFYFFNSFYENLNEEGRIDNSIEYSEALYRYYVRYLHRGLKDMPKGTRIATYHSLYEEIPLSYDLVDTLEGGNLNFWIKKRL